MHFFTDKCLMLILIKNYNALPKDLNKNMVIILDAQLHITNNYSTYTISK